MKYEEVTQWLIELRRLAQLDAHKKIELPIGGTTLYIRHRRGSWDYRVNGIEFKLQSIESALMLLPAVPALPGSAQCVPDDELAAELAALPAADRAAVDALPCDYTSNGVGWSVKNCGPWDVDLLVILHRKPEHSDDDIELARHELQKHLEAERFEVIQRA